MLRRNLMYVIRKIIALLFVICLLCACSQAQKIDIISNSKSQYHIVISPTVSASEKEAADTLQAYLFKISGCRLPVTKEKANTAAKQLIIGNAGLFKSSETAGLNKDGILIKSVNSSIVFGGGRRKGSLYSVYTFLDSLLKCKMYTHDLLIIPETKTVSLPLSINIRQNPAFDYRMSAFINLTKGYCDFNKQNYLLEDWGLWVHSFEVLVPKEKYFASHPEYFALVNGKRTPTQLCLSNPDVVTVLVANLRVKMKENPSAKYWSVSQNDNEQYCQCEECKKLDAEQDSHQGSLLTFVNKVAAYFPDKTITDLAYLYSQKPPATLQPAGNVMIMICTIYAERSRGIMGYGANQIDTDIKGWQALTKNVFIWDYTVQFSHAFAPFPNLYSLQPNVQYFKSRNVPYLFEQGFRNLPSEFSELRTYIISKLMWNAGADVKSIMHNFIEAYYGKSSAPYIEQYINLVNANSQKTNARLHIFGAPEEQKKTYLTQGDIENYKAIFQKAFSGVQQNSAYYNRISKEYLSVLYSELAVNGASVLGSNAESLVNKPTLKKKLTDFYALAKKLNIQYLSDDFKSTENYYKTTLQALQ